MLKTMLGSEGSKGSKRGVRGSEKRVRGVRGNKLEGKVVRWEGPLTPKRWWALQKIVYDNNTIGIIASEREQEGNKTQQGGRNGDYLESTLAQTEIVGTSKSKRGAPPN